MPVNAEDRHARNTRRAREDEQQGMTTVGVAAAIGVAVLVGVLFGLSAQGLSEPGENVHGTGNVLVYAQRCRNAVAEAFTISDWVVDTTGTTATAALNKILRESDYSADFNSDGDTDDLILSSQPAGGVLVTTRVSAPTGNKASISNADALPAVSSRYEIQLNLTLGCWTAAEM